jgi:AAA+ superfamily predicted ATPase
MTILLKNQTISSTLLRNARTIDAEIDWCVNVMNARLDQYFSADDDPKKMIDVRTVTPPEHDITESSYARFISEWNMSFDERITLAIALIPHVRPSALDHFFLQNKNLGRPYTEFGGWSAKNHQGFLPTCETVAFVLAGGDLPRRLHVSRLFDDEHYFKKMGILRVERQGAGEPFLGGALQLSSEYLSRFTLGRTHKPDYCSDFPAKLITSKLTWDDLVLEPDVREDIAAIETWLVHSDHVMHDWGLEKNVKPGYRCLFFGPPGTGKTLTATLLGASVGLDVYRIDLSMVVSKYIGETEKNLANVFDQAQSKNWILFFDEADALFGKRTQTASSNDRFANQEVSYLLQRIEDCPNVVILASNLKSNIDEAFARRFQSAIYFPMPAPEQRLLLWKGLFPRTERLGSDVRLEDLAQKYELSGGALTNVARFAALRALRKGRERVSQEDLVAGVKKEIGKEGRTM